MNIEEYLENLNTKAIPWQEEKIILMEKLLELTGEEQTDTNAADIALKKRHIDLISKRIKELEEKMNG